MFWDSSTEGKELLENIFKGEISSIDHLIIKSGLGCMQYLFW